MELSKAQWQECGDILKIMKECKNLLEVFTLFSATSILTIQHSYPTTSV